MSFNFFETTVDLDINEIEMLINYDPKKDEVVSTDILDVDFFFFDASVELTEEDFEDLINYEPKNSDININSSH